MILTEKNLRHFVMNELKRRRMLREADGKSTSQSMKRKILDTLKEFKAHIERLDLSSITSKEDIFDEIATFNGADKTKDGFSIGLFNPRESALKSKEEKIEEVKNIHTEMIDVVQKMTERLKGAKSNPPKSDEDLSKLEQEHNKDYEKLKELRVSRVTILDDWDKQEGLKDSRSKLINPLKEFNDLKKDPALKAFASFDEKGFLKTKSPTNPGAGSPGSEGKKTDSDDLETRRRNWAEGKRMLTDDKMKEILTAMFEGAKKKENPSDKIQAIIREIFMRSEKPVYEEEIFTSYLKPLLEKLTRVTKVIEEVIGDKPDFEVNDVFEAKMGPESQPLPDWLKGEIFNAFKREPRESRVGD